MMLYTYYSTVLDVGGTEMQKPLVFGFGMGGGLQTEMEETIEILTVSPIPNLFREVGCINNELWLEEGVRSIFGQVSQI